MGGNGNDRSNDTSTQVGTNRDMIGNPRRRCRRLVLFCSFSLSSSVCSCDGGNCSCCCRFQPVEIRLSFLLQQNNVPIRSIPYQDDDDDEDDDS